MLGYGQVRLAGEDWRVFAAGTSHPRGHGWIARVDGDGPGIAPEQRERMLERLQRGQVREAEGRGLGRTADALSP